MPRSWMKLGLELQSGELPDNVSGVKYTDYDGVTTIDVTGMTITVNLNVQRALIGKHGINITHTRLHALLTHRAWQLAEDAVNKFNTETAGGRRVYLVGLAVSRERNGDTWTVVYNLWCDHKQDVI